MRLSANAVRSGEQPTRQDLAIPLHRQRTHGIARIRIERINRKGKAREPGDVIARLPADFRELSA